MSGLGFVGDINEILDFAIEKEIEAQKTYLAYAASAGGRSLRKLLLSMVDQEKDHEKSLRELKERGDVLGAFQPAGDVDIELDKYTVDIEYRDDMNYQDFLLLVIKKEEKSYELYKALEATAKDTDVKYLFSRLAEEEKKHKKWAQDRYDLEILTDN